jgi:hypothetical protein
MPHLRSVLLFGAVVSTAGCVFPQSKAAFMTDGLPKAAFDMQCDTAKLEVTELQPGSMGVRGCGKQGRYEWLSGSGWVLNSGDDNERKK